MWGYLFFVSSDWYLMRNELTTTFLSQGEVVGMASNLLGFDRQELMALGREESEFEL